MERISVRLCYQIDHQLLIRLEVSYPDKCFRSSSSSVNLRISPEGREEVEEDIV